MQTALIFGIDVGLAPWARCHAERFERLREQLGREPTPEEYARYLGHER